MLNIIMLPLLLISTSAFAEGFQRPIPQAQSATAEYWFALASLALLASLWLVHKLVSRK